jgi:hypothetical protein
VQDTLEKLRHVLLPILACLMRLLDSDFFWSDRGAIVIVRFECVLMSNTYTTSNDVTRAQLTNLPSHHCFLYENAAHRLANAHANAIRADTNEKVTRD